MSKTSDEFEDLEELEEDEASTSDEVVAEPVSSVTHRRIFTDKLDPKIYDLHQDWKSGDLVLDPKFQRRKVWDDARSSRLIESVLLEVPLPVFYLAENSDGSQEVIDGQQRLNAFFRFFGQCLSSGGAQGVARPKRPAFSGFEPGATKTSTQLSHSHSCVQKRIRRQPAFSDF
jgi:hypothetical protein